MDLRESAEDLAFRADVREFVARHLLHGPQHGLIADAPTPQRELKHHLFRRVLIGGHRCLRRLIGIGVIAGVAKAPSKTRARICSRAGTP